MGLHSGALFFDTVEGVTYETVKMPGASATTDPDTSPAVVLVFCACTPVAPASGKKRAPSKKRTKKGGGGGGKKAAAAAPPLPVAHGKSFADVSKEVIELRDKYKATLMSSEKHKKFFSTQVLPALKEAKSGGLTALKQLHSIVGQLYRDLTGQEWDDGVAAEQSRLEAEYAEMQNAENPDDDLDLDVDMGEGEMEAVDAPQPPKKKATAVTKKAKVAVGDEMEQTSAAAGL